MRRSFHGIALCFTAGLTLTGAALANGGGSRATIDVNNNITTSTTWTANNVYRLEQQIYVEPGASLTIEAGTLIASRTGVGGSLAVARGGQIFIQGTADNPVIMTSEADTATWTNGDPKTGTWREAANEWGNLTIMGAGYISENATVGNVPTFNANNVAQMEGLVSGTSMDQYGGGNDDDDSGSISHLSIRYGGRVIGLGNELNGLSLGGVGRGTDLDHIEIMNNVDDGIEIWGGCVNIKNFAIWNIGDDSFDVDQGWRGKAQFGLIVQGWSLDAPQGSGVGDNGFETDGGEDSDWQPTTTAVIYNCTFIGQPVDGDGATAWRDNARVQYRNSIFKDCGEKIVRFDNIDGDGANGYGFNGTLSWADTWTTDWNAKPPHPNDPNNFFTFYKAQTSGKLAEITDSVFYRNQNAAAYDEADLRGVFDPANNNVKEPANSPIRVCNRGPLVSKGGKDLLQVVELDPRPVNEALTSVNVAPDDGFFTPGKFRGAIDPGDPRWIYGWTAAEAFGFLKGAPMFCFDVLDTNGNDLGNLVVDMDLTATVVQSDGSVLCDYSPINIISNNPVTVSFQCGPVQFFAQQQGGGFAWQAGPFSGTLVEKP